MNVKRVSSIIRDLLIELGEDPDREGLKKTPERVARAYAFLTQGYRSRLTKLVNQAVYKAEANNMIVLRNIEVYSLCEHHMLPFFGECHIGYIAKQKVVGVSKMARIVDFYARRLQIQERLTAQIANAVMTTCNAEGVGVVMDCQHLCMMMRGVEKEKAVMTTSSVLGSFHNNQATRSEFMSLIRQTTN
jgi:GTP cyclohydrolase IA